MRIFRPKPFENVDSTNTLIRVRSDLNNSRKIPVLACRIREFDSQMVAPSEMRRPSLKR